MLQQTPDLVLDFLPLRLVSLDVHRRLTGFAEVEHHSVERALVFFGVGLFVFVSTIVLVARGPEEATPSADAREGGADG